MKKACTTLLLVAAFLLGASPLNEDAASKLFAAGSFDGAASAFREILAQTPDDTTAALGLGALRLYQNDLDAAEPLLKLAQTGSQRERATRLLAELDRRRAEEARRATVDGGIANVPFVRSRPLPVVHAVVNGVPGTFLVDTGGPITLEPDFARRAGIESHEDGSGTFLGGKTAPIRSGMARTVNLGTATAYDVPVTVFGSHAAGMFENLPIDGVVGSTLFERFLVTIDYPNQRLTFRPRAKAVSASFQASAANAGAVIVPCWLVGDHIVFARASVNGVDGMFAFDSGMAGGGLMLSKEVIDAAHINLDTAHQLQGMGGGGPVPIVPFVADTVAVGTAEQHGIHGAYAPGGSLPFPFAVAGTISDQFLRNYAYTVDFEAMRIVLATPTR